MMDRPKIQKLRTSLQAALDLWAEQHDLKPNVGNASFTANSVTFKVELAEKNAQGEAIHTTAALFTSSAHLFGLKPTDLGRVFTHRGKNFKIVGLAPRSYRFPILAECVRTGKVYKFPAESVKNLLWVA